MKNGVALNLWPEAVVNGGWVDTMFKRGFPNLVDPFAAA